MAKKNKLRLLREFIRENIGMMFGLDRHVSMNALSDVVGGPDPEPVQKPADPVTSYAVYLSTPDTQASVLDHLEGNIGDEIDASDDITGDDSTHEDIE